MLLQTPGQPMLSRMEYQQTLLVSAPLQLLHCMWPARPFTGTCLSEQKVLYWCNESHNLLMTSSMSSLV